MKKQIVLKLYMLFGFSFWEVSGQLVPIIQWVSSWFDESESIPYILIRQISLNLEERLYNSTIWYCVEEFSTPERYESKRVRMLSKLHSLRNRLNLVVTVPLSTKVDHRNGALSSYEMCLPFPEDAAIPKAEPQPKQSLFSIIQVSVPSSTVKFIKREPFRVYSLGFGGYADTAKFKEKLHELQTELSIQRLKFNEIDLGDRAVHFHNVYNSASKFWNRRNEVWVLADEVEGKRFI